MRCKRCGELLEPTDTHCPVCGKTLTPPRKKAPSQKPAETHIKLPQLDKFAHAYSEDAARSRTLQLLTIAATAAVLVLLVLVYINIGSLQGSLNQLQLTSDTLLQSQQSQVPTPTEPPTEAQTQPPEDPTESVTQPPVTAGPLPLGQQHMEAELTLYQTSTGTYAAASMDLGDFEDQAAAWVGTTQEGTDRRTGVVWILEASGDRLDLTLRDSFGGTEARFFAGLTWDLEGSTFHYLSDAVCIWEYRLAGGEWESLPIAHVSAIPGGCEVRLSAEELEALLSDSPGLEMRCHVSMSHPDGGTMKMVAGGISLNAEGLMITGGMLD